MILLVPLKEKQLGGNDYLLLSEVCSVSVNVSILFTWKLSTVICNTGHRKKQQHSSKTLTKAP